MPSVEMNPPPDKKRKTGQKGEWDTGQPGRSDDPWGEDYTEDELEFMFSQAEVNPDEPTESPAPSTSYTSAIQPSKLSKGGSKHFPVKKITAQTKKTQQSTLSERSGQGAGEPFVHPSPKFPESLQKRLDKSEKDLTESKKELSTLKDDLTIKDGEIAMQRETIRRQDAEIFKYKQEKVKQADRVIRERSAKEKKLQDDLDKLEGQIQFKEQELLELRTKCRNLELQNARLEGTSSTPTKLSTQSPRVHHVERRSPKKSPKFNYPTVETFHAETVTAHQKVRSAKTDEHLTTEGQRPAVSTGQTKAHHSLEVSEGVLSGPLLVKVLFDGQVDQEGEEVKPPGIVRLLQQLAPAPINFSTVQLERDAGCLLFSPKHPRSSSGSQRSAHGSQAGTPPTSSAASKVVSGESIALATRGLTELLECHERSGNITESVCTDSDLAQGLRYSCLHSAIFLLPLINDYLGHYLEMLSATVDSGSLSSPNSSLTSLRTGTTSSSDGSSLDSVSSSLKLLLRDGTTYANNLEELTLAALNILYTLTSHCPEVTQYLRSSKSPPGNTQKKNLSTEKSTTEHMDVEQEQVLPSTSKIDPPEFSPSSSGTSSVSSLGVSLPSDLFLLHKVVRLADPGNGNVTMYNQRVVESALDILYTVCHHSAPEDLECLLPLVTLGVFHDCLGSETSASITSRCLRLLSCVVNCPAILSSLCSAPDGCVFLCLYPLCSAKTADQPPALRAEMLSNILDCLTALVSGERGSSMTLLDSSCVCNLEVVKSVTLLLHTLLEEHSQSKTDSVLALIRRGVSLLHLLSQHDPHFGDHHDDVEHNYVDLVCGLTILYKHIPAITDHELSALHELWDFDQDDSELSQDDEGDES